MSRPAPPTDTTPCILCGGTSLNYLYPELDLVKCVDCGLVRAKKIPPADELRRLYSESYFKSSNSGALGYDDYAADRVKIEKTFQRRMQEIETLLQHKGRLLDVGCATGFSLEVANRLGWETKGVEISEYACELARTIRGTGVFCGQLEEADFPPESFDVVTMWDYLEHCPNPAKELEQVNRLLKGGGLLALTTPDISSLVARFSGTRWMGIKQGEHLFYFSRSTITRLLSKYHFEPVRITYVGKYVDVGFFIRRTGIYSSAVQRLLERLARTLGIRNRVIYVNPFDIMLVYATKMKNVP